MNSVYRLILGCVLTVAVIGNATCHAQQKAVEELIASFDAELTKAVEQEGDGCVMVGVFRGPTMVWSKGFGWADIERKIAATRQTIGRTGSISKSFTAVVVAQLAEQGAIGLDDPVRDHFVEIEGLSNPPEEMKPITFRMLASHTAGLIREPRLANAASGPIEQWENKILLSIPKTTFKTTPKTEYSYSNIGFGILGLAASRAAKKPFIELVNDQIFEPLEMNSSSFAIQTDEMKQRLAVGYSRDRRTGKISATVATREHAGRGYKVPNGGVYSTVGDMAKFASAMMGTGSAEILSPASREEVFTPQRPAKRYGLGFTIVQTENAKVVGHGGSVAGYNADLRFDLASKFGVAMLRTSSYNPPTGRLLKDLIRIASDE